MEESKIKMDLNKNIGLTYILGLARDATLITDKNPADLTYFKQIQIPDIEIIGNNGFCKYPNYYSVMDKDNKLSHGWYIFAKDLVKTSDIIICDYDSKNRILSSMVNKDTLQMEDWIPGDLGYYPPLKVVLNLTSTSIDDQDAVVYPINEDILEKILKNSKDIRKIKRPNLDVKIELSEEEIQTRTYSKENIDNTLHIFGLNKDDMHKMNESEKYVIVDSALHCLDNLFRGDSDDEPLFHNMMNASRILSQIYIKHHGIITREFNP